MKPFAYGFAAFDAETCPQPGDAKIFQLLLDSRKIAWRKFHDSGGGLIHEARKSKRAVIDLLRREAVKQDRQCQVAALFRRPVEQGGSLVIVGIRPERFAAAIHAQGQAAGIGPCFWVDRDW